MLPEIFHQAKPILNKIEQAGFAAYFVGGSVRDYLLKRNINDVDIATSAFPEEIKQIFSRTVDIGIEHGTVLVIENGKEYEITTFRTESSYGDFRRPDKVEFIRSLEGDLERRDFTMNSIAMDQYGNVYDPFSGQKDINDRIIRTVGSPAQRFSEDALRMMRGIRFVSQLGFHLELSTQRALSEHIHLLGHIAVERKTMEFEKILNGKFKKKAFSLLIETELYKELPHLSAFESALEKMKESPSLEQLDKDQTWLLLLTFMEEKNIQSFLKSWRLPSNTIKDRIKEFHVLKAREKSGWAGTLLYYAGLEAALNVEAVYCCLSSNSFSSLQEIKEAYDNLPIKSRQELKVSGNDLMEWSQRSGGPWIKEQLSKIEAAIINRQLANKKNSIRRWLKECNQL